MSWLVTNIVWDTDGIPVSGLPTSSFVPWDNGCKTGEEAINLVSDCFGYCILSCNVVEE